MNVNLNIPFELVDIDAYFNYVDVLLDDFFYAEKAISTEGIVGDIWEGIKKAVKWLIEKIGQFISFIINLIKRIFNWIAGFFKGKDEKHGNSIPKNANRPDKHIVVEGDRSKAQAETNKVAIASNKTSKTSTNNVRSIDNNSGGDNINVNTSNSSSTKANDGLKFGKLSGCVNIRYNVYAIANTLKKFFQEEHNLTKLDIEVSVEDDGSVAYKDNDQLNKRLTNLFAFKDACDRILTDNNGYYHITYDEAREASKQAKDLEMLFRSRFINVEYISSHLQNHLKKFEKTLDTIKNQNISIPDFSKLIANFIGMLNEIQITPGAQFRTDWGHNSMRITQLGASVDEDKLLKVRQTMLQSMIRISKDVLAYLVQVSKPYSTGLQLIVRCHKEMSAELTQNGKNDIDHIYYHKNYEIPNDITTSMKRVFDLCESATKIEHNESNRATYLLMQQYKKRSSETKFNLKTLSIGSAQDKEDTEGNAYTMRDTTIHLPLNVFKSKTPFSLLTSQITPEMFERPKARKLFQCMLDIKSAYRRFAVVILHEAKHAYDYSNEKYKIDSETEQVAGDDYDSYGGMAREASADKGARDAYIYFRPLFDKVTRWLENTCKKAIDDMKAAGINAGAIDDPEMKTNEKNEES